MDNGTILSNEEFKPGYYRIVFHAPEIAAAAFAGQFVHVRAAEDFDTPLRRPFSIHDADAASGELVVVYKVVGRGTAKLAGRRAGDACDLMGPLGHGYSPVKPDEFPVLVAGGYGSAATYMLAKTSPVKGALLLGARSAADLILAERYEKLGFEVHLATNDGSAGHKGLVTDLIDPLTAAHPEAKFKFYACGPHGMLMALTRRLQASGLPGEISLDHLMCCGVGACFACVVKIKDGGEWRYARSCNEGPVFDADAIWTED